MLCALQGIAATHRDSVVSASIAVFASMAAVIAALTLLIVAPTLYLVDRGRDEFLLPFLDIPTAVITRLAARTAKHMRKVESAEAADDCGDDDDGRSGAGSAEGGSEDDGEDENGEIDWATVVQQGTAKQKGGVRRVNTVGVTSQHPTGGVGNSPIAPRRSAKSLITLVSLFLRFAFPFLLLIAFFAVIFATTVRCVSLLQLLSLHACRASANLILVDTVHLSYDSTIRQADTLMVVSVSSELLLYSGAEVRA
jgi:hypothetical protein